MVDEAGSITERLVRGRAALRSGDLAAANAAFRSILESDPSHAEATRLLGTAQAQAGRLDEAEIWLSRALELDASRPETHDTIGQVQALQSRTEAALAAFERALELRPDWAAVYNRRGEVLGRAGRLDAAASDFREALALDPDLVDAHFNLGIVHLQGDELEAAVHRFALVVEREPEHELAWHRLGVVHAELGDHESAAAAFARRATLVPTDPQAQDDLGTALQRLGRFEEAVAAHRRASELAPNRPDLHFHRGLALQHLQQLDEARAAFEAALRADPGHLDAVAALASVAQSFGDYEQAASILAPHLGRDREHADLVVTHADLMLRSGNPDAAVERVEALLEHADLDRSQAQRAHYVLGGLYDKLGEPERAFAHIRLANELDSRAFQPEEYVRHVDRLIAAYSAERMTSMARSEVTDERAVFVLGMPRSGTTLVEQILAAHPEVHGAGERGAIGAIAGTLGDAPEAPDASYPECSVSVSGSELAARAMDYLGAYADLARGVRRVTDKTLNNFLHVGLIEQLLPHARIVHCRRDPLDVAVSCYFRHFTAFGTEFALGLEHIGIYYREYERLMEHWGAVSALPMHVVDYESMVGDHEHTVRALIDFLELPWNADCLTFHASQRVVLTASHAQVRRPVYSSAVGRHRAYEAYLEPFKRARG